MRDRTRGTSMARVAIVWLALATILSAGAHGGGAPSGTRPDAGKGSPPTGNVADIRSAADRARDYSEDLGGGVALEMVWVRGGKFLMGSRMTAEEVVKKYGGEAGDEKFFQDERPLHTVELDGFWMGKFEVTNAQFRKFRPGHSSGKWEGPDLNDLNGDKQPVVRVPWNDAKAFCDWLSDRSDKSYTLPTEAQWEYACRAGTETERYWGDDDETMGRYANVCDQTGLEAIKKFLERNNVQWKEWMVAKTTDGYVVSAPVGSFTPNKFGLYDMIGNVWEWCADWYGEKYYTDSPGRNPMGPASGRFRVLRGGGWLSLPGSADRPTAAGTSRASATTMSGFGLCGLKNEPFAFFFSLFRASEASELAGFLENSSILVAPPVVAPAVSRFSSLRHVAPAVSRFSSTLRSLTGYAT